MWQYLVFAASLGILLQTAVSKQYRYIDVWFYFIKRKSKHYEFCAEILVDTWYSGISGNVTFRKIFFMLFDMSLEFSR